MKSLPEYPFGLVVWEDAYMRSTSDGGLTIDEITDSPVTCHMYGFILRSNAKSVTVASEYTPEDKTWRLIAVIPRKMVISEETLALVKPRKKKSPARVLEAVVREQLAT